MKCGVEVSLTAGMVTVISGPVGSVTPLVTGCGGEARYRSEA